MEVNGLDLNLELVCIIDTFKSLIWTDRYYGAGDFEINDSPNIKFISKINHCAYLTLKDSEHTMVVESVEIKTSFDNQNDVIVRGRSLESILDRRIIWSPTALNGNFQNGIEQLLNENAINPDDPDRMIARLEFEASTDPVITALTVNSQFWGESLYKAILDLCVAEHIGFKITLTDAGMFRFKLYSGIDRSYNQEDNPYVVFSPGFDNLLNSSYKSTSEFSKTVAVVAGEAGVSNVRRAVAVATDNPGTDLDRRELFVDATGVNRRTDNGDLTDEQYDLLLQQKGLEELAKNVVVRSFEGEADTTVMYIYGEDFFMGDIVQVANEYGNEGQSRVTELILSQDGSGVKICPSFNTF